MLKAELLAPGGERASGRSWKEVSLSTESGEFGRGLSLAACTAAIPVQGSLSLWLPGVWGHFCVSRAVWKGCSLCRMGLSVSGLLPICETDTREFTDNKHHGYLNTRGLATEGGSPHFPNKIPEQRACWPSVDETVRHLRTMFPVKYPVPSSPRALNITHSHGSRPLHCS